jgi:hypothetical protein
MTDRPSKEAGAGNESSVGRHEMHLRQAERCPELEVVLAVHDCGMHDTGAVFRRSRNRRRIPGMPYRIFLSRPPVQRPAQTDRAVCTSLPYRVAPLHALEYFVRHSPAEDWRRAAFASIYVPPSVLAFTYSISFPTASAILPGSVQGVVVHASTYVPGSSQARTSP